MHTSLHYDQYFWACIHVVSKCTHIGIKLLSGIENLALVSEPQSLAGLRQWGEGVGRLQSSAGVTWRREEQWKGCDTVDTILIHSVNIASCIQWPHKTMFAMGFLKICRHLLGTSPSDYRQGSAPGPCWGLRSPDCLVPQLSFGLLLMCDISFINTRSRVDCQVSSANLKIRLLVVTRISTSNSNTSVYINAMVAWDDVCDSYFQDMSSASVSAPPPLIIPKPATEHNYLNRGLFMHHLVYYFV